MKVKCIQVIDKRDNKIKATFPEKDDSLSVLKKIKHYKFKEVLIEIKGDQDVSRS